MGNETASAGEVSPPATAERVFLVIVDDTEEMRIALRYASRRASHTDGRVALLYVLEPVEFQHWLGVGRMMEDEARADAEIRLQSLASDVFAQTGKMPVMHLRQGQRAEQLVALITEDPSISLVVLATAPEASDPGPLVSHLIANMGREHLRVPITLVPGHMSEDEIDLVS